MKNFYQLTHKCVSALFILLLLTIVSAVAQTTAFTYHGRLTDGANSAPTGTFDIKFDLYDTDVEGTLIGSVTNNAVFANQGIFSTSLNFGAAAFAAASVI